MIIKIPIVTFSHEYFEMNEIKTRQVKDVRFVHLVNCMTNM